MRRSTVHADLDTYAPLAGQLHVSLNGADSDEEAPIPFGWYDPPNVLGLSPNSGPVLGGTPIAVWAPNATDGAGTDRRCRFTPHFFQYATEDDMEEARLRTTEVAATRRDEGATNGTLRCVTPALPPDVRAVELEVSLNGQQFMRDGVRFTIETEHGRTPSAPNGYAEGSISRACSDSSTSPFIRGAPPRPSPDRRGTRRRSDARRRRADSMPAAERRRRADTSPRTTSASRRRSTARRTS